MGGSGRCPGPCVFKQNLIPYPAADFNSLLHLLLWVLQLDVSEVEGGAQPMNVLVDLNDHPVFTIVCNLALHKRTAHGRLTSSTTALCSMQSYSTHATNLSLELTVTMLPGWRSL